MCCSFLEALAMLAAVRKIGLNQKLPRVYLAICSSVISLIARGETRL
jgi:hypothetical protein